MDTNKRAENKFSNNPNKNKKENNKNLIKDCNKERIQIMDASVTVKTVNWRWTVHITR